MKLKNSQKSSQPLYIGIDAVRNVRDLAMGHVDKKNVAGVISTTDLLSKAELKKLNVFYNHLQAKYGSEDKNNMGAEPVKALMEQNMIVVLPLAKVELPLVKNAENNSNQPSWVNVEDGTGFRYDAHGNKMTDFPVMPRGVRNKLAKLLKIQSSYNELNNSKSDMGLWFKSNNEAPKAEIVQKLAAQIESINEAVANAGHVKADKVSKKDFKELAV